MLTDANNKAIDKLLDTLTPFSGIVEILTDIALPIGVDQLDRRLLDKINPIYHNVINEIISHLLIDEDYELAKDKLAVLFSQIIDTPLVDGTAEEVESYNKLLDLIQIIVTGLITMKKEAA